MHPALNRKHRKRHDHRQSLWLIRAGHDSLLWCYRCGAIKFDVAGAKWHRTTGLNGTNPAL